MEKRKERSDGSKIIKQGRGRREMTKKTKRCGLTEREDELLLFFRYFQSLHDIISVRLLVPNRIVSGIVELWNTSSFMTHVRLQWVGVKTWNDQNVERPIFRNFEISKGGGQNFERHNVERMTFRNFKIANIKITKNIFSFFRNYLNSQNI